MSKQYTVDEMIDAMKNPTNKLRSIAELDKVVEEIIDRNPEWYAEFEQFIQEKLNG
jgi:histone deacetylase complex regulatory component SIN3